MSEINSLTAVPAESADFIGARPAAGEAQLAARPDPITPDDLPWAQSLTALSDRMSELPLQFQQMMVARSPSGIAAPALSSQVELNTQALRFQLAVMSTSLTAQAAVQLLSSTSQVANKLLNQQ
jgi:hypothetical protein